jgi:hypothetical protein
MIVNEVAKKESDEIFSEFFQDVKAKINNASVMLQSKDERFTASGVIYRADETVSSVFIATAKHNLWVMAGMEAPPDWDSQDRRNAENNFKSNIQVFYENKENTANVSDISYFGYDCWEYDIMLLEITDADFLIFASQNCVLTNEYYTFFANSNNFKRNNTTVSMMQTGYGASQTENAENHMGNFAYRLTYMQCEGITQNVKTGFDVQEFYNEVYILDASDSNTTWVGDSGGPLFAVKDQNSLFLVGITLGSNYFPDKVINKDIPVLNNAATSINSLLYSTND